MSISSNAGLQFLSDDELDAVSGGRGSVGGCLTSMTVGGGAGALAGAAGASWTGPGALVAAGVGGAIGAGASFLTSTSCNNGEQSYADAFGSAVDSMVSSWF